MRFAVMLVNSAGGREKHSREILGRAGYSVQEVSLVDDPADLLPADPPLAVILEPPFDETSTVRLLERLREFRDGFASVPILALGQRPEPSRLDELFSPVSFIPDPCSARSLLQELAHLTRPRPTPGLPTGGELNQPLQSGGVPPRKEA